MIFLIIGFLVGVIISIIDIIKEGYEFTSPFFIILFCFVFSIVPLSICSISCSLFCEIDYIKVNEVQISALNDNNSITGKFFIGSGYIEEEMIYYYVENTDKGKIIKNIDADDVYIIEDNNERPRIEVYRPIYKNKIWYLIALNFEDSYKTIYIPENSITTEYNINLE